MVFCSEYSFSRGADCFVYLLDVSRCRRHNGRVMNKSIAIIRPFAGENRETFCRRALHIAEEITATCSPAGLKLTRTVEPPPRFSVIPFRSDPVAVISAVGAPDDSMNAVAGCNGVSAFFAVSEAMPVNGEPLWALNEPAPGAGLLTLFRARKDISRAVFLDRWFNGHTPLTLQLHPLTNYNRNEVLSTIGPGARHYDGIVEERTACRADLPVAHAVGVPRHPRLHRHGEH
jgi:hypothetical protein